MIKRFFEISALIVLILFFVVSSAFAFPNSINYLGKLTDSYGDLLNGEYSLTFKIYSAETSGEPLWTEEQTVTVTNGIYNAELGAVSPFPENLFETERLYMELIIYNEDTETDETLSPRIPFNATGYSMKAKDADKLNGMHSNEMTPPGMIAMFMKSCPVGWTEFLQMRGRFPRGEPNGDPGSLSSGGSDDATLVKHTHSARASDPGPHRHSGITDSSGSHTHDYYDAWYSEHSCLGDGSGKEWYGSHSSDYDNHLCLRYEETFSGGNHYHSFSTNYSGSHTHTITIDSAGSSGKNDNIPRYQEVIFCIKD